MVANPYLLLFIMLEGVVYFEPVRSQIKVRDGPTISHHTCIYRQPGMHDPACMPSARTSERLPHDDEGLLN